VERVALPASVSERTVRELLARNASRFPEKAALIAASGGRGERRVTYRELAAESAQLAAALAARGVGKGDRVGILLTNQAAVEAHLAYHASHVLGAVNVPLNCRYIARELEYVMRFAAVKAVVFESAFADLLASVRGKVPAHLFLEVGDAPCLGESFRAACEKANAPARPVPLREDDDADWIFTSGTTGNPKAVALTHANSVACGYQSQCLWGVDEGSVFQSSAPFYTSTGCHTNLLACLAAGCTYVIETEFNALETMRRISRYRTTSIFLVSGMLQLIFDRVPLDELDLGSLRRIAYGGMPMARPFYLRMDEVFRKKLGKELVHLYGLTEGGTAGTLLPPDRHEEAVGRAGRHGLSIGTQGFKEWIGVRVLDEQDRDVPPGETGEICLKAPSVMDRYVNEEEATAAALRGGWLHTGDMGMFDAAGYLYFVDRKKQIIRRGGINISSAEIEGVIAQHPAVEEVAVIPRPNPVLGEEVKAVVALKEGRAASAEEIIEFAKKDLADYKVPVEVQFLDRLPRNAMGRVMKGILKGEAGGLADAPR
jgi:acyl-CoA synthetase (AMP-forming)/AMP-acid ligase II